MLKVFEQITGLKKAATKREAERKELADVIEQERLVEVKGKLCLSSRSCGLKADKFRSTSLRAEERLPQATSRGEEDGRESRDPRQWSPI